MSMGSLANPAPLPRALLQNVRKGSLGNAICTLLWNSGAVNYDVKIVVRVRRLVRAYTLIEV